MQTPPFPGLKAFKFPPLTSIERLAFHYASEKHAEVGQLRKHSGKPYIVHPMGVASILRDVIPQDSNLFMAGLLHDTLEDTRATEAEIRDLFGGDVLALVLMVSSVSKKEDGNRKVRKEIDLRHYAQASDRGMSLKLADIIHNCVNVADRDPLMAKVYLPEKQNLIAFLDKGHPTLLSWAKTVVDSGLAKLVAPPQPS